MRRWRHGQRHHHRATRLNPTKHPVLVGVTALGAAAALIAGFPILKVAIAAVSLYVILWIGTAALGGLVRPTPEPPPPGEMRKVRLVYRCELCGTEVRMTASPTEEPEPPRHCMEEMTLITPLDEI